MIWKLFQLLKKIDKSITLKNTCNIVLFLQDCDSKFDDTTEVYNLFNSTSVDISTISRYKEKSNSYIQ